ncbi:Hypothetical predicted protein [Mytilus galloprovincialis]|uniref:Chitin-binding type-2 domain-containing protein n=1 Tax=Mytilus galloprovincialis TaxID=29158 RepID=A0A8B6BT90_MYTGA|nr:Hypothetical predicted protein [Mytilus galloprovincialis]
MLAVLLLFALALGTVSTGPVDKRCAGMDSSCCSIQDGTQVLDLRDARCQTQTRKRDLLKKRSCEDKNSLVFENDGCEVMCTFLPWGTYGCLDEENRTEWFYCRNGHSLWDSTPGACDKRRADTDLCTK